MQDPLDPIVNYLRPHLKTGWNAPGLLDGFKAQLRALGVTIPGPAPAPAPPATPAAPAKPGPSKLTNPGAFFDAIRPSGRFSALSDAQRVSIEADIAAMSAQDFPIAWAAYVLATEYHETGGDMVPNRESLNYRVEGLLSNFGRHRISEADARRLGRKSGEPPLSLDRQIAIGNLIYGGEFGREELGNTEPGDGYKYRGGGKDHCTGRANFKKVDDALGLGGALVANPDLILVADNASRAIVTGMKLGRYTNKKLAHFLPDDRPASVGEFRVSRPIINRMDRADDIAAHAIFFQTALQRGGYDA